MTVTIGSKSLNLLSLREISDVKAVKLDRWESDGYKRRYSPIGLLRKWRLECIEKNVAWMDSAAKYFQEQAAQASKLDFIFPGKLDESCVLHLPFDEGDGSIAYDKSGNNNNSAIYGATWVNGKIGKALSFNGVDAYGVVPNSANLNPTEELTLAVWFKYNAIKDTSNNGIVSKNKWLQYRLAQWYANRSRIVFSIYPEGGPASEVSTGDILNVGEWYFIVGTAKRGGSQRIYVNGELIEEKTLPDIPFAISSKDLQIGRDEGDNYINGVIDETRIYNRALNEDEIRMLYLLGSLHHVNTQVQVLGCKLRFNPLGGANIHRFTVELMEAAAFTASLDQSCVLYLPMDEGSGEVAYDKSEYGNNGTLYNNPVWVDGKYGKALSFNGVDSYVRISNDVSLQITGDLTIAFWIKLNSLSNDMVPIDKHWNGEYFIKIFTDGKLRFVHGDGTAGGNEPLNVLPAGSITTGEWIHIAIVRATANKTVTAYKNSEISPLGSLNYTKTPVASTQPLYIGMEDGKYNPVDGVIDEVHIYNRALSADEIQQLYLSGAVRIGMEMLMPTDICESFELAGGKWDAYENESYIHKLAVLGQKRTWRITFIEKNVPWTYSAAKYLQYKAWKGEPVYFKARLNSRYETEEVEAYITSLELNLPSIADKNIRRITVTLKEA